MSHLISNTTITRKDRLHQLKERERGFFDLQFIKAMDPGDRNRCIDLLDRSRSQVRQDLFALSRAGFRQGGFFVEFGATDGVETNNTWLLEHDFGWTGILAEPARRWHGDLKANRTCIIDTRCVWSASGEKLRFTEATPGKSAAISPVAKTSPRPRGTQYEVETITLNDLLEAHNAPHVIDYMSVDTDGSEFDILNAVDFDRWSFQVLTVEHNFAAQREDTHALLTSKGYARVHEPISRFDDWYVRIS